MKEIEFVCHNSKFPNSTPLKNLKALYATLKRNGYTAYMQDFSNENEAQFSLATIYKNAQEKNAIAKLAKEHKVKIDMENNITAEILQSRLKNNQMIKENVLMNNQKYQRKRRRAFHRKRSVKIGSSLSHGGALERSHNMVVGQVFRRNLDTIGANVERKEAMDTLGRIYKHISTLSTPKGI